MYFCYTIMSQFWQGLGEITVKYLKSFFLMTTKTMNILEVVIDQLFNVLSELFEGELYVKNC